MPDHDLTDAALELAESGVRVFPVGIDKKPRNSNGFHGATTDPETIKKWDWNSGGGIAAAIDENHFVLDIDPRNSGDTTIMALIEAGLTLPATRVVETQNGGSHRYYKLPEGMVGARLRGTMGPGVDIKASGKGYVLVPPTPGYTIKFDGAIVEAPQWMLDELVVVAAEDAPAEGSSPKFLEQFQSGTAYGQKALEGELGRLAATEEGGRNNALNRAAFAMAQLASGGELDEDSTRRALYLAGERMGLDQDEIIATVASGWKSGIEIPRQAPLKEVDRTTELEIAPREPWNALRPQIQDGEHFWLDWENADDSPPPYYLFPVIPKNAYVLVYGATEASKSMVFMALACEASHRGIKSSIYSLENPSHIDIDRTRRWGPDSKNFRITNQFLDINDARQVHDLAEREKAWNTDWVIIDTYSHAFSSRSDDGNAKAIEFARRIRWVMRETGCTIVLVDHTGYADHGEPRDASAKRQQVDVAIKMSRPEGYVWEPNKPASFLMENHKSARFGNPFNYAGAIQDVPGGSRGLKLHWANNPGMEWRT